jgi:hypothetical protein
MTMTIHEIPPTAAAPLSGADLRPEEVYGLRIARDGTWFHQGSPIGRIALVKLFATVLRRDECGDYWLITPAERGRIAVDDAPFVAVELKAEGEGEHQSLSFRTNLDHWVTAGAAHPIMVRGTGGDGADLDDGPAPYILVRDRLEARIGRAVFYELVGLAVERPTEQGIELGVWSERVFFPLGMIPPG